MNISELVSRKVALLPQDLQEEVVDFIDSLKNKHVEQTHSHEITLLSQDALSDWDSQAEDEAWKDYQ